MRRDGYKELLRRLNKQRRAAEHTYCERLNAADKLAVSLRRQSDVVIKACQLISRTRPDARRRKVDQRSYETDNHSTLYLRDLISRVQQGDEAARIDLQALLDKTPDLWREIGDLARHVETNWINFLANDPVVQESLKRECQRRRAELLGDDPTPIERHLVEMIVTSWLQVQHAEIEMANSARAGEKQLNFLHRRLESAQKQHLAAINQLVKVQEAKAKRPVAQEDKQQPVIRKRSRKRARRRVVAA